MKIQIKHILLLVAALILLHVFALSTGMYTCEDPATCLVWVDNVAHGLGGVLCGMLWIWGLQVKKSKWLHTKNATLVSAVLFVTAAAILWEFFEFAFLKLFTEHAYRLALYSPSLQEASADVISNLVGGILFILLWIRSKKESLIAPR